VDLEIKIVGQKGISVGSNEEKTVESRTILGHISISQTNII